MRPTIRLFVSLLVLQSSLFAAEKPKLTLDEFFNSVSFSTVKVSPDGKAVVMTAEAADWDESIFRSDLWLYRDGTLTQLTQSGHDSSPQWSPDGHWIAFLSSRDKTNHEADPCDGADKETKFDQLYVISPTGGEALPVTRGAEEVHSFTWSADSRSLFFAIRSPRTKEQKEAYKKEWQDTCQYRASERGDVIFKIDVAGAVVRRANTGKNPDSEAEKDSDVTPGSLAVATTQLRADQLAASPDGQKLAVISQSISQRQEKIGEFEIYTVDLANAAASQSAHQLTHNEAVEQDIEWSPDSKRIFFMVDVGSVEGKYKDTQTRLYSVDASTGNVERWASDFKGAMTHYAVAPDGGVIATGRLGTGVQLFTQASPSAPFSQKSAWSGTFELPAVAAHGSQLAFVYSTLEKPTEIYIAESTDKLGQARAITHFNQLFTERDLPKGKPYRWTADDGVTVEGMLMYPPGKFEAKNLPVFVYIHGGPADADGNHFEADWYQWDRMAATEGWLVFEPNYRGSSGYGDKFLMGIVPELVSKPGRDILEGVDALVKDGIADPDHLAIGGYSYGSYMTNWLITQTTRFKAAVTGAGAVEHIANWGNDDTTFDDVYFLGGLPWEVPKRYQDEGAIFQINKVRTPTHIVVGDSDIRVAAAENYILDHALHNLGIPTTLLSFPGEGHSLDNNPWHGKIKVREELKWIGKYGLTPAKAGLAPGGSSGSTNDLHSAGR